MNDTLAEIEEWIGRPLPEPYRAFLGGQTDDASVGDVALLYGVGSFIERNKAYETKKYSPGFVTIGDDGGGRQFLLPLTGGPVTMVDAGSMNPSLAESVAEDFEEWREAGCPLPDEDMGDDWEA